MQLAQLALCNFRNIEEADLTEAIMELELANQAMSVAQSVATKIIQATLLNR